MGSIVFVPIHLSIFKSGLPFASSPIFTSSVFSPIQIFLIKSENNPVIFVFMYLFFHQGILNDINKYMLQVFFGYSSDRFYFLLDLFSSSLIHCKSVCISASLVSIFVTSISSVFFSSSLILEFKELQVAQSPNTNTIKLINVQGSVM